MSPRRSSHDIWREGLDRYDTNTERGRGDYILGVRMAVGNIKAGALVDFLAPFLDHPELWRSYEFGTGQRGEWRAHEFDYFLAANGLDPRWVASQFRQVDLDAWAKLVKAGTRPRGRYAKAERRDIDEVADQIRAHIVVGDKDQWVDKARRGFEDKQERMVATNPKNLAAAKRTGSVRKVSRPNERKIQMNYTSNGASEPQQQAEAIVGWLERHPDVGRQLQRRLRGKRWK